MKRVVSVAAFMGKTQTHIVSLKQGVYSHTTSSLRRLQAMLGILSVLIMSHEREPHMKANHSRIVSSASPTSQACLNHVQRLEREKSWKIFIIDTRHRRHTTSPNFVHNVAMTPFFTYYIKIQAFCLLPL